MYFVYTMDSEEWPEMRLDSCWSTLEKAQEYCYKALDDLELIHKEESGMTGFSRAGGVIIYVAGSIEVDKPGLLAWEY